MDNNALATLKSVRIGSDFFRNHCCVSADVLREAEGHPETQALESNVLPVTPEVIEQLRRVMHSVAIGDTRLVDLYKNKGAADPSLVASLLDARAEGEGQFLPDVWVLVSNDQAVLDKATEFDFATLSPAGLADLIDAAQV